jgi:uncharacterized protein (TIGR00266 family)
MEYRIAHEPPFPTLEFNLDEGESVLAQPKSMLCMTPKMSITAEAGRNMGGKKGIFRGVKSMASGESFFTAVYRAKEDGQEITLAPESMGDVLQIDLDGGRVFMLTRGSFLACLDTADLALKYGGMKGLWSKKGLFLLRAAGEGPVFCASFGTIVKRELEEGERFIVDNRFVIAFEESVGFELVKATKSLKHSFMSGEGLVNRYTGPGTIYYQTRGKPAAGFFGRLFDVAT